jgi:hypothetical protein
MSRSVWISRSGCAWGDEPFAQIGNGFLVEPRHVDGLQAVLAVELHRDRIRKSG